MFFSRFVSLVSKALVQSRGRVGSNWSLDFSRKLAEGERSQQSWIHVQRSEYKGLPHNISWGRMTEGRKRVGSMDSNFSWGQINFCNGILDELSWKDRWNYLWLIFFSKVSKFCRIYFQNKPRTFTSATFVCIWPRLLPPPSMSCLDYCHSLLTHLCFHLQLSIVLSPYSGQTNCMNLYIRSCYFPPQFHQCLSISSRTKSKVLNMAD